MEALRVIKSLPLPEAPEVDNKAPTERFTPEQVKVLKTSNYIHQGDLERITDNSVKQTVAGLQTDTLAVRDMPNDGDWVTAANYAFLSHFKENPQFRATTITRLEQTQPKPKAYLKLLKNLDGFLKAGAQLSDDELMMFMSLPAHAQVIAKFTHQITEPAPNKVAGFATALGIRIPYVEGPTTTEYGSGADKVSKTLVNVVEHYVVLEAKPKALPLESLKDLVLQAQKQQSSHIKAFEKKIESVSGYDAIQDLHMQLLEASRIATSVEEKRSIETLLGKLRLKEESAQEKSIVHLQDLLKGIEAYSKLLSDVNYHPGLAELQRKKKLMEFNIRQLQTEKSPDSGATEAFAALYGKILAKLRTAQGHSPWKRPAVNMDTQTPVSNKQTKEEASAAVERARMFKEDYQAQSVALRASEQERREIIAAGDLHFNQLNETINKLEREIAEQKQSMQRIQNYTIDPNSEFLDDAEYKLAQPVLSKIKALEQSLKEALGERDRVSRTADTSETMRRIKELEEENAAFQASLEGLTKSQRDMGTQTDDVADDSSELLGQMNRMIQAQRKLSEALEQRNSRIKELQEEISSSKAAGYQEGKRYESQESSKREKALKDELQTYSANLADKEAQFQSARDETNALESQLLSLQRQLRASGDRLIELAAENHNQTAEMFQELEILYNYFIGHAKKLESVRALDERFEKIPGITHTNWWKQRRPPRFE